MQQSAHIRRTSARTAIAIMLAVVGMLAIGGAWSSATAAPGNSGNENSNGNGPPADGSVGNADDKAPGGQHGNDKNKGYECDSNKGVGKGNPAHTGTCSTDTNTNTGGCTGVCDTTTTTPTTAPGEEPIADEVLGLTEEMPAAPAAAAPAATQLAFTGITADVLGFLGLALVAFGAAFMLIARRNDDSLLGARS
jgi:hypothetical protein